MSHLISDPRSSESSNAICGRQGELMAAECPSRSVLSHVCSRWGVLVLVVLRDGTHRFSEIRRKIGGVSEKMLAQTLQNLEYDGFVNRKSLPVVPPHVEYRLTPMGEEIALQVETMARWIEGNMPRIMQAREAVAEPLLE
ncbi:helix-turn-helix domain-containing protein [Pseudomonas cichorii]|uniref:winged helix-turn-helix transcriptional regulator n=1 Tax=Pseudomonas cichorii TaxID=36746 RepID=UPI001C89BFA8|nr:helix-turn-helix domain-containing protein [Pseudomonas cichorii]MBX8497838.1 helix-turn-helix transcriptional regulator [Pseudomonas cichorii]MBX8514077.1 helix-turn-helix transcriptional regulator [Pseudomonas cichorii]MBX8532537.1 helix-turn-helix transcriptional regulator [Pseudomonas cichorii]MBX8575403.1 helix-turn-helix transcriptional regulator [Pseudomonas cichorii]